MFYWGIKVQIVVIFMDKDTLSCKKKVFQTVLFLLDVKPTQIGQI